MIQKQESLEKLCRNIKEGVDVERSYNELRARLLRTFERRNMPESIMDDAISDIMEFIITHQDCTYIYQKISNYIDKEASLKNPLVFSIEEIEDISDNNECIDSCDDAIFIHQLHLKLLEQLNTISVRESNVLKLRFYGNLNYQEISDIYHTCGRKRIQQVATKGLKKLRHPARSRNLKHFLDFEDSEEN